MAIPLAIAQTSGGGGNSGGGGGGTIPNTTNLLAGGASNTAANSGIAPSNVALLNGTANYFSGTLANCSQALTIGFTIVGSNAIIQSCGTNPGTFGTTDLRGATSDGSSSIDYFFCNSSACILGVPLNSAVGTGQAPFSVASTTLVPNLNVQVINGVTVTGTPSAGQGLVATSSTAATWGAVVVAAENVVTFSTTPAFSVAATSNIITLTASLTSWTIPAGVGGQPMTLTFCQNGTGGATTGTTPANVRGFFVAGITLSTCSSQPFVYSSNQSAWLATSAGVINQ